MIAQIKQKTNVTKNMNKNTEIETGKKKFPGERTNWIFLRHTQHQINIFKKVKVCKSVNYGILNILFIK